ncbi:MAG: beta-xylosidase [Bryobacteraceae bacterium]|jgi:xylan 1,4-beta-xylosidase
MIRRLAPLVLLAAALPAQEKVAIRVDAGAVIGPWRPVCRYFGYDEPNYTYMQYGKKLVGELTALAPVPVYFRAHSLLVTGDGQPALKWGSTNAYTEDAAGKPVYDWTIIDRIFDTYLEARGKPLVEIGFMPQALSVKPEPYRHDWPKSELQAGWAYPPKDYGKWAELIHQWVKHCVGRYGKAAVESWWWELWNEPDIFYWTGTPEEYDKLYDYTADAVKRALPTARVGGPATTGPRGAKAAAFLRQFLEHCSRGANAVTGTAGAPLDFVSFHAKGAPKLVSGRVRMGTAQELADLDNGFAIVASFPELAGLPVIVSEWDPEGCAACSARTHPQNAYRNTMLYPANRAVVFSAALKLADKYRVNLEGLLTWAFEFEGQPYFDGFRTLATNGVDKPVLNFFRMAGLMGGNRVKVASETAAIDALATARGHEIAVMVWNYDDEDAPAPAAPLEVVVEGIPPTATRVLLNHYRIDQRHSNAYTAWKEMGAPQNPSPEQYARLEAAGRLELLESPRWLWTDEGKVRLEFSLPRQGLSLLHLSW